MQLPVRRIRGHHIEKLEIFLYEMEMDPNELRRDSIERGYGLESANKELRIWNEFLNGECAFELIAGELDEICLPDCPVRPKRAQAGKPCDRPESADYDRKIASRFFLEISEGGPNAKTYTYADIARNLHNYYLDQHGM